MTDKLISLFKEFLVEFLGGLVPGFIFMIAATPILVWASLIAWATLNHVTREHALLHVNQISKAEFWIPFLVVSYVMGGIFFRQDPKDPDNQSARYILERMDDNDRPRHAIFMSPQPTDAKKEAQEAVEKGGQFPYANLKRYLQDRGLDHLAEMVPWSDQEPLHRTKNFVNILKIRLRCAAPEKYEEIVRYEAQIRMMSSLWYAARAIRKLASLFIALTIAATGMSYVRSLPDTWGLVLLSVIVVASAISLQLHVRRFLHYQRVREIVFVLETAWFVANKQSHREILEDLA